jgi:hypothetical protein
MEIKGYKSRKTAEMKFMGRRAEHSLLDRRRNDFLEELTADTTEKIAQYKEKWLNHVSRTEDIRYPK